jgi:hypothetical protein
MSRPSDSNHGIAHLALLLPAVVGSWMGKALVLQVAIIGLLDLIAAGVLLLALDLGRQVLAPRTARWRARRRKAYVEGLRAALHVPGNGRLLPMISPCLSNDPGSDPPRPFDPQAAARFRQLLEFGDPYAALRGAGLRACDVLAWLEAGLNRPPEGDPRRDFAMQVLEFIRRRRSRRGLMRDGEPHAPMPDGLALPERRSDEMIVSPLSRP